jgi:hypothetical protein
VTVNGGHETLVAYGTKTTTSAPWLISGHGYTLRLYSIAPVRRLLAQLRVTKKPELELVGTPAAPTITSPAVDSLLELLSYIWIPAVALLGSTYILAVRRHG